MEIELKGKKGVVALLIILVSVGGYLTYTYLRANKRLTREAVISTIDPFVKASYVRQNLPGLRDAVREEDLLSVLLTESLVLTTKQLL